MNLSHKDIIRLRQSGFQVDRKDGKPISGPPDERTESKQLKDIEDAIRNAPSPPTPKVEVYPQINVEAPNVTVTPVAPTVTINQVKKWRFDFVRDDFGHLKYVTATAIE